MSGRAAALPAKVKRTLGSCGWSVGQATASVVETVDGVGYRRWIDGDGNWRLYGAGKVVLAEGKETEPALAAMEVNERFWTIRDSRRK